MNPEIAHELLLLHALALEFECSGSEYGIGMAAGIRKTMASLERCYTTEIKRLRAQLAASQARADGLAAYVKSLTECQCWAARDPSSMTADEFEKKAHAFERMIDLGSKAIGWLGDKP